MVDLNDLEKSLNGDVIYFENWPVERKDDVGVESVILEAARLYLESQRPVVAADTTGMPERVFISDKWGKPPFEVEQFVTQYWQGSPHNVSYRLERLCPPQDVLQQVADALDGYTLKGAMGNKASLALALLQPYLLKKDKIPDPPGSIHQYHDED